MIVKVPYFFIIKSISNYCTGFPILVFPGVSIPKIIVSLLWCDVVIYFSILYFVAYVKDIHVWLVISRYLHALFIPSLNIKGKFTWYQSSGELKLIDLQQQWYIMGRYIGRHKPRLPNLGFDKYTSLWSCSWELRIDSRVLKTFLHGNKGSQGYWTSMMLQSTLTPRKLLPLIRQSWLLGRRLIP